MLRLITFDGVVLSRDQRPVSGVQNRRLALSLLLVLAARGARGITRDALIDLLWPDDAVKDPRHSLDQLLSVTRTSVQGAPLISGTSMLRLDADGVHTDVDQFDSARTAGRLEEMVEVYRAPFADGFHTGPSTRLAQFLDETRARYAREHAIALRTLAERSDARGDHAAAARWYTELHAHDRLDGNVVQRLLASLTSGGEAHTALRVARGYATLLREELGREDPEITRWIHRLSSGRTLERASLSGEKSPRSSDDGIDRDVSNPSGDGSLLHRVLGGRYRLEQLLRPGRIVTTYLGVDSTGEFGLVEVHVLAAPIAAASPASHFAEIFQRVQRLTHATLLPTLDAGIDGTQRFVVTAQRPGDSLEARLARHGALPVADALRIARDAAHALAIAHDAGLRHGDVRPKHIALRTSDAACVTAFGLGECALHHVHNAPGSASLILGSTVYHSPEQLLSEVRIDACSDVYALGCILYEMLTGEPPFGRSGVKSNMLKLSQPVPSVRAQRDTVSERVATVVHRCLERTPADRYQNGGQLLTALVACIE